MGLTYVEDLCLPLTSALARGKSDRDDRGRWEQHRGIG